jgi:conjugative relaxase-like TrwC/TraI family protein
MLTTKSQKNRPAAEQYFDEHLTHNDYYSQGDVRPGRWIGQGSERLDLKEGEVIGREEFLAFCDNRHPVTGEALTPRRNRDGKRRLYYDFTCSAPKSVSILGVTMHDQRIVDAHLAAARIAIKELEQFAASRVRQDGKNEHRATGNLVGAEFLHNSSRTLDPQLHTHFILFNCTYDPAEQRWKALETFVMHEAIHYGTEVYRNELANRLHALGYETERTAKGFEIKGVSPEIRERFSKRSSQIKAVVAQLEQKRGRKLSNNQIAVAVHRARPRKVNGISQAEVRQHQLDQISSAEHRQLSAVVRSANGSPVRVEHPVDEQQALNHAQEHVFERASTIPEYRLLHAALLQGRGQVELASLKDRIRSSPEFVRVAGELSTREILYSELSLINTVDQGKDRFAPIHPHYIPRDETLGADQRQAVSFILRSLDQITGIRGLAGTGKSRTLKELWRAFEDTRRQTVSCAPTGSAAQNLCRDGLPAITLQRLLVDEALQSGLARRSIIMVDEAGIVSTDDMQKLFSLAIQKQARVILCGDTGQHTAVMRGDALRILEKYSRYSFVELTENWRQKSAPQYQRAVRKAARQQSQRAFELLEKMGAVVESDRVHQQAADAYIESVKMGKSALLVSPTWNEIHLLTDHVRTELKRQKLLGNQERNVTVFDSLSWTVAEKKNLRNYVAGQVIVFHRRSGAYAVHESLTVVGVENKALRVRQENGRELAFRPDSGKTFDVCESKELTVASGDKLLLQARCKAGGKEFVNGEIVQVKAIDQGEIRLSDGRRLPRNFRRFAHGYAVTSHAAQSQTVQDVFVVASSPSLPAIHRRQFYVDISRGKERCRIFTDDKELLRQRISDPKERKAAIELSGLEQTLVRAGLIQSPRQDHLESGKAGASRRHRWRGISTGSVRPDRKLALVVRHLNAGVKRFRARIRRAIAPDESRSMAPSQIQSRGVRI